MIGWGYGDEATFASRHMQAGTQDPAAYLSVPAAIEWQEANAWETVRDRCHELANEDRIEVLAQLCNGRPLLRMSFQGYNDEADLDRLVEALARHL